MLLIQSTILLANLEFHTHIKQADVYNLLFVIPLNCAERTEPSLLFSLPAARAASRRHVPSETQPCTHRYTIIWISQFHSLSPLMPCSVDTAGSSFLFGSVFFFFFKFLYYCLIAIGYTLARRMLLSLIGIVSGPGLGPTKPTVRISPRKGKKANLNSPPSWFCF